VPKGRSLLSFFLKTIVTGGLLYVVFQRAGMQDVVRQLSAISGWWIALCALALFAQTALTAVRWLIVLRHLEGRWRFIDLWRYVVIGSFFNQFLPSGMGGDVFRIWYVRQEGLSWGKATASVITDRVIGLVGLFVLIAAGIPYLLTVPAAGTVRDVLIALAVALALAIAAFLWLDVFIEKLARFAALDRLIARSARLSHLFEGVQRTSPIIRNMLAGRWGFAALALSIANQLLAGAVVFAFGIHVKAGVGGAPAMLLFPFVLLVSMVPISLAGWGMREGAMVVVFSLIGTTATAALAMSLLFGIALFVAALPGGVLWLSSQGPAARESKA